MNCLQSVRRVHALASAYKLPTAVVHVHPAPLGYESSMKLALDSSFDTADFVIVLRDDFELAPDALAWMEHARKQFAADEDV